MKKYVYITGLVVLASLAALVWRQGGEIRHYRGMYEKELSNVRAFEKANSSLQGANREFQYTIAELRFSVDSINQKLVEAYESLKIKDRDIKYLQYQASKASRRDTIYLKADTVFEGKYMLDTVIGDAWYTLDLKLDTSSLVVEPTFRSEKYVVISSRKEYVKPPSKVFFIRWFQRKYRSVFVDVHERSPYIEEGENRFINIIK